MGPSRLPCQGLTQFPLGKLSFTSKSTVLDQLQQWPQLFLYPYLVVPSIVTLALAIKLKVGQRYCNKLEAKVKFS